MYSAIFAQGYPFVLGMEDIPVRMTRVLEQLAQSGKNFNEVKFFCAKLKVFIPSGKSFGFQNLVMFSKFIQ